MDTTQTRRGMMQAFAGIRVLDLTHVLAGPYATYQLALLGADVIKIDPPGNPDMVRAVGSVPALNRSGMGADFQAQAANKRAITLDLGTKDGAAIFRRLVGTADVVVENYQAGSLERMGLGYAALTEVNPRLIYCSLSGYGHTGPLAERPSYDAVIKAHSGLMAAMHRTSRAAEMVIGPPILDYATGAMTAFAIAGALLRRERTGDGQRLDVSMLDAAMSLLSVDVTNLLIGGETPDPDKWDRQGHPGYRIYDASDGPIMIGAWTGAQTSRFWAVLGFPDRAAQAATQSILEIEATPVSVMTEVQRIIGTRTAGEWETLFTAVQIPAARVRTLDEVVTDPQVVHRGTLRTSSAGVAHVISAHTANLDGPALTSDPPGIGAHTEAILAELGLGADEIEGLRQRRVV